MVSIRLTHMDTGFGGRTENARRRNPLLDKEGQRLDQTLRTNARHMAGTSLCGSVEGVGSCTSPAVGCGNAIYRGITTGLNDAFIIDNQTKDATNR